jgi:Peptidase family M28/PA domain
VKSVICILLICSLVQTEAVAQTHNAGASAPTKRVPAQQAHGYNRINEADLQRDLTYLASDELEGRLSLSKGSELAIKFVADEFQKAGLKPASGGSFLQPVPLIEYLPDPEKMGLKITHGNWSPLPPRRMTEFKYFTDFTGGFPENITVKAAVVFAGYGITAPEFHYDDYAGLDAKGKIVLVFDHEPQENDPNSIFNGIGNTRYANARLKIINAQKHGAVGVLVAPEPNRQHPSNFERVMRIPGANQQMRRLPSQALDDGELKIPLFSVNDPVTDLLFQSSGKQPKDLQSAIDADLKPQSMPLPDTEATMTVVDSLSRKGTSQNVIGMIEGNDPQLKNETIIFSSHYDHNGVREDKIYHGADDNGSGTVGVIELARAFAANPQKPKRTLMFISFAGEERGLLGSYYYASHPLRPLETTRAVINFDMIGRNETPSTQTEGLIEIAPDTSNELNLIGTINSPAYRQAVEQADQSVGLKLNYKWDKDAALNIFQRSDQFPFALHDIPAVWWFTGFHPDYHQPTDTVEKINFKKMANILRLAYLTGWEFANQQGRPTFNANPMAGTAMSSK